MTRQGQCDFLKDFLTRVDRVPGGLGKGGVLSYIKDKGPCGNEWANQALFDYEGKALPSLQVIRDFPR